MRSRRADGFTDRHGSTQSPVCDLRWRLWARSITGLHPMSIPVALTSAARAEPLLAKEVDAPAGPAATQARSAAAWSVNDRESPWVTLLTGM